MDGEMASFGFRVAFFAPHFEPTVSCYPKLICSRIVRACNVLSVHKYATKFK